MGGVQSALSPAGPQASAIAGVTWLFFGVCAVVYILVIAALVWAIFRRRTDADDSPVWAGSWRAPAVSPP
jgi:cytochrome c oxidase subunit 2